MDAARHPHMQGSASSSSSCRAADFAAAWDAEQQQKRQRCHDSSDNQVGSSTENNSVKESGPEFEVDNGENEEEDYYFDDEEDCCYDDDEGSDYEIDTTEFNQQLADKFDGLDLPPGVEATVPWLLKEPVDEMSKYKTMKEIDDEIAKKYNFFKQFDTVEDFSDHHYAKNPIGKPRKEWVKRIQHEWSLLEKDLPALIYVRVSENRMDLLRAVMVGPQGTPYHDGLFFFDAHFPPAYPTVPPFVYYHSGGLRLNPNLYACGKVCLSLLGTWHGNASCEKWNAAQSTMLQVLVSIQALVLNENPYFNEPGYEMTANTTEGQRRALDYNDTTFQYSCRTMLYSLRKSPQHFEDLVAGHFRERGPAILSACKYYMKGHKIGSRVPEEEDEGKEESKNGEGSSSRSAAAQQSKSGLVTYRTPAFNKNVEILFEELLMEFNVKGADTAKFRAEKLRNQQASA